MSRISWGGFGVALQCLEKEDIPPIDFHLHTNWTDGANSVSEMHARAVECQLRAILFSEHVRKTSGAWFHEFAKNVRALAPDRCQALVGIETKVADFEGNIDCSEEILQDCDLVIASVHRFPGEDDQYLRGKSHLSPKQALEKELRLALAVLDNPEIDILGHPFGMAWTRFRASPSQDQLIRLIEKAGERKVAFEINSKYHSEPLQLLRICRQMGVAVSFGSDAHSVEEVGSVVRILKEMA